MVLKPQSQMGVDFKALTIQLQAQLDERVQGTHEIEAAVHARVHAEYASRLARARGSETRSGGGEAEGGARA